MLIVRLPLLLAYFTNIPGVLDYLPIGEGADEDFDYCLLARSKISLALHNETLIEAMRAHSLFIRKKTPLAWMVFVICGIHFFCIMICDAIDAAQY